MSSQLMGLQSLVGSNGVGRHVGEPVAPSFASRGKPHMDGELADPARRLPLPRACRTGSADNAGKQVSCARNESLLPAQRSRSFPAARAAIPGKNPTDPTRSEPLGFTPVTTEWPPTILGARGRRRADQLPSPRLPATGLQRVGAAGGVSARRSSAADVAARCAPPRRCCRGRRDPLPPSPFSLPPRSEMISRADPRRIAVSVLPVDCWRERQGGEKATTGAATWLPICGRPASWPRQVDGQLKPVTEWADGQRAAVAAVDVLTVPHGDGTAPPARLQKLRLWNKVSAWRRSRHFGLLKKRRGRGPGFGADRPPAAARLTYASTIDAPARERAA